MSMALSVPAGDMMEPDEELQFETITPPTFRDVLAGTKGPTETMRGLLYFPQGPREKLPLMIISIGSRGFESGREALYKNALIDKGIAVLIADSFGSRGFAETVSDQSRISAAATTSDILRAFVAIADDPRIDTSRVALMGYSRGGTVTMLANDERLQNAVMGPNLRFAAHVALYASCTPQWANPHPTKAPILMIFGGQDVLAPPAKGTAYGEKVRAAGGRVEMITFPEAHHSFDANRPATPSPNGTNLAGVLIKIADDGEIYEETTGLRAGDDYGSFYKEIARRIGGKGSITGNGPLPRDVAVAPILKFVSAALNVS